MAQQNLKRPMKLENEARATPDKLSKQSNDVISLISSDEENQLTPPQIKLIRSSNVESSPIKNVTGTPKKSVANFYSPIKKRSVKKQSPMKPHSSINNKKVTKMLFQTPDELEEACIGQDDKTKFLLRVVHDTVRQELVCRLLSEQHAVPLRQLLRVGGESCRIVCRLYWRKPRWYRPAELMAVIKPQVEDDLLQKLLDFGFIIKGLTEMNFDDYVEVLKQDEIRNICKDLLKIKPTAKQECVDQLRRYSRSTSKNITNYFIKTNDITTLSNEERVLQAFKDTAGECYKLSDTCREALDRVYVLMFLGVDDDIMQDKTLELMLINEKSGREVFPSLPEDCIDGPDVVFQKREEFESYMMAKIIQKNFTESTDKAERRSYLYQAYNMLKGIKLNEYKRLPQWLRRFTPAYVYMSIIEKGLPELKQGKDTSLCRMAVDMLTTLVTQNVMRQHKHAAWFDEKALILHMYLHEHNKAAEVLLEGLQSELPDELKDKLRPRASKLACQKNISLDDAKRSLLLAHAAKQDLLESSLPCTHFYKQPKENTGKGKLMFEFRNEDGTTTMSSVEHAAISLYKEAGQYNNGRHWEGRIVTTIFFLLFWDIIYRKPSSARGIFLSRFQKFPLDLFYDCFYEGRKEDIDDRLQQIEQSPVENTVASMLRVWRERPQGEQSGLCADVGAGEAGEVVRCLGTRAVSAICRRLATRYRHANSGFPDLTLWNKSTGQVKFVEVKSDSDKPSLKQIQWIQFLVAHGVPAELCYVGTRPPRHVDTD